MILTLNLALLIASAISFLLAVLNVGKINWIALGLLFYILSIILK